MEPTKATKVEENKTEPVEDIAKSVKSKILAQVNAEIEEQPEFNLAAYFVSFVK